MTELWYGELPVTLDGGWTHFSNGEVKFSIKVHDAASRTPMFEFNINDAQLLRMLSNRASMFDDKPVQLKIANAKLQSHWGMTPLRDRLEVPAEIIGAGYRDNNKIKADIRDWFEDLPASAQVDDYDIVYIKHQWLVTTIVWVTPAEAEAYKQLIEESETEDEEDEGDDDDFNE